MRNLVLASVAAVPLLLGFSQAADDWSVNPPAQPWVFSSEDGGTGSYLGVDITDISTDRLGALKLKEEKGVEVTMVDQDAPAGKAGIKEHDVILAMNGATIESGAQLRRMIHETPAGRVVTFGLSRDGQPVTVKVQLGNRNKEFSLAHKNENDFHFEMPKMPMMPDIDIGPINVVVMTNAARSGLMVENITPQLGEFFGVKNGNGVLIRSVEKGSRAEKAGFRAGDVIVKVNDQAVHDTSDFSHAVRSRDKGSVNVGVVRDKREQNLSLPLPERKDSSGLLQEESFEDEPVDAETYIELGKVQEEIAKLRPQLTLALEDTQQSVKELTKSVCDQKVKFRKQAEILKQQLKPQQDQFKKDEQKLKMQMDRLRKEIKGTWLDI
jgi:membrane-associated protease RseP (regulator of RpoE activity)